VVYFCKEQKFSGMKDRIFLKPLSTVLQTCLRDLITNIRELFASATQPIAYVSGLFASAREPVAKTRDLFGSPGELTAHVREVVTKTRELPGSTRELIPLARLQTWFATLQT